MQLDKLLGTYDHLVMPRFLQQVAKDLQNDSFQPAVEADFSWLDGGKLASYEREFAALGFESRGDWAPPSFNGASSFMRLMGHESEKSHVALSCVKTILGKVQPVKCALSCALSEEWSVSATDREANPIQIQFQLPRAVVLRDCDAMPAALWQDMRQIRDELQRELHLQIVGDASAESFFKWSAATAAQRAELVLGLVPLEFAIRRRVLMRTPLARRDLYTGDWKPQPPPSS